jgi:predicted membrane channel-forming protein YqfA (hemolysin III family)
VSDTDTRPARRYRRRVDEKRLRKKHDQELIEILNEVRVALAGASVLFGFLLIVPFSAGWDDTSSGQETAYILCFVATVFSVIGLMTPTAYHRARWRERNKERMLRVSHLGAVIGIAFLAIAMTAATYFVMDEIASTASAVVVTALTGGAFVVIWLVLPLSAPYERWDEEFDDEELEQLGDQLGGRDEAR